MSLGIYIWLASLESKGHFRIHQLDVLQKVYHIKQLAKFLVDHVCFGGG